MDNTIASQIDRNLVLMNQTAKDRLSLLSDMADFLYEKGYVTKDYKEAIFEREKKYPTGLKLDDIQFAIPHTDADKVIKPGIIFIQLKEPVEFTEMGSFDSKVNARIVFMLLLHNDGSQVELLQDIIARCTKKGFISSLENAKTKEEVLYIIDQK